MQEKRSHRKGTWVSPVAFAWALCQVSIWFLGFCFYPGSSSWLSGTPGIHWMLSKHNLSRVWAQHCHRSKICWCPACAQHTKPLGGYQEGILGAHHRYGHLYTQNLLGRNVTAFNMDLPLSADISRLLCPCWKTPLHIPVSIIRLVYRLGSNRLNVMPLFSQDSGSSVDLYLSLTATLPVCNKPISAFSFHRNFYALIGHITTSDVFHQQVLKHFI